MVCSNEAWELYISYPNYDIEYIRDFKYSHETDKQADIDKFIRLVSTAEAMHLRPASLVNSYKEKYKCRSVSAFYNRLRSYRIRDAEVRHIILQILSYINAHAEYLGKEAEWLNYVNEANIVREAVIDKEQKNEAN